jgi:3-oxoadipate enol-lactonase
MRVKTSVGDLYVEDVSSPLRPGLGGAAVGVPVILWHSFLHHGGMWRGVIDRLRTRHRVINIDAPGHGRSAKLERPITMDDCAAAVATIYDACNIDRAHFAGLSWGGMVGLALSLRSPSMLASMALFDTSCRAEPLKNRMEYAVLARIFRVAGAIPPLMKKIEKLFFADATLRNDRAMVDEWQRYVARLDGETVWNGLQCIAGRRDLTPELSRVRVQALVVVGSEDRAQPPVESRAIAAAIPGARLITIEGAGHLSALERPREAGELLANFFAEHERRAERARA